MTDNIFNKTTDSCWNKKGTAKGKVSAGKMPGVDIKLRLMQAKAFYTLSIMMPQHTRKRQVNKSLLKFHRRKDKS